MINIKKIFFITIVFTAVFYSSKSFAESSLPWPYVTGDIRDVIEGIEQTLGSDVIQVDDTAYFKLCEIRRMFCGTAKVAVISIAVFTIGFLLVIGKLKWITLVTVMGGLVLFTSAETIAISLVSFPPNLGVVYSCYCIDTILSAVGLNTWSNSAPNWLQF